MRTYPDCLHGFFPGQVWLLPGDRVIYESLSNEDKSMFFFEGEVFGSGRGFGSRIGGTVLKSQKG